MFVRLSHDQAKLEALTSLAFVPICSTLTRLKRRRCGFDCLKKTGDIHGLRLKGVLKVCEDCAVAKARQQKVAQDWKEGSQELGEIVYLDIRFY